MAMLNNQRVYIADKGGEPPAWLIKWEPNDQQVRV